MMPCSKNAAGYYHYATGSNESYEETLPKVKAAIRICQTVGEVDFLNQNTTLNIFMGTQEWRWMEDDVVFLNRRFSGSMVAFGSVRNSS